MKQTLPKGNGRFTRETADGSTLLATSEASGLHHERSGLLLKGLVGVILLSSISLATPFYSAGATIGEAALVAFFFLVLVCSEGTKIDWLCLGLFGLGVGGGIITKLFVHSPSFTPVLNACVGPFIMFYCSQRLVRSPRDAWLILWAGLAGIVLFAVYIAALFLTGGARFVSHYEALSVLAIAIDIGAREFTIWGNWTAGLSALGFALSLIFLMRVRSRLLIAGLVMLLAAFTVIGFKSGAKLGPACILLAVLYVFGISLRDHQNRRQVLRRMILLGAICFVAALSQAQRIADWFNMDLNRTRYEALVQGGLQEYSVTTRMELVRGALADATQEFVGSGFNTKWMEKGIDESNFYAYYAQGTGLLGVLSFVGVLGTLLIRLFLGLSSHERQVFELAVVGILVLLVVGVALIGSDQLLGMPESALKFWGIVGAVDKVMLFSKPSSPPDSQRLRKPRHRTPRSEQDAVQPKNV